MSTIDFDTLTSIKERIKTKFPLLLETYIHDAQKYIDQIEQSILSADIDAIIDASHSLKSSSALLGVTDSARICESIEYAAKTMKEDGPINTESLKPECDELKKSFSEIKSVLTSELEKAKAEQS